MNEGPRVIVNGKLVPPPEKMNRAFLLGIGDWTDRRSWVSMSIMAGVRRRLSGLPEVMQTYWRT